MTTNTSSNTTTTSANSVGISLPDPFLGMENYTAAVNDHFLQTLFLEGCREAREFGLPVDGSRYFWSVSGQLVRIYSKSLIRALRRRIKEAERELDQLKRSWEFKIRLAKMCGIRCLNGFDSLLLQDAIFATEHKKAEIRLHLLHGATDYIFVLSGWLDNFEFVCKTANKITM